MSELSNPLPLPPAHQVLKERADLLTAWEAINEWYGEAVSPTGLYRGDGFLHFAGPILLAIKYLGLEFKLMANDLAQYTPEAKQGFARGVKAVMTALKWAPQQRGVDALINEFKTSLAMTVHTARTEFHWLFPKEEVRESSTSYTAASSH